MPHIGRRPRNASAHAKRAHYCTCGKVVYGNGGKGAHAQMHQRESDGHRWVSVMAFRELFPGQT